MLIDTHSHLFDRQFKNDLELCIKRAKENNVLKIILVGYNDKTNKISLDLSKKYDIFYNTCGIHPSDVRENYIEEINKLENFIINNKTYAIGECGLDYYHSKEYVLYQKEAFIKQIDLSIKYNLPLIVHMRDATKDTYDILKKYQGKVTGVMHCYTGSYEMALEFIKIGFLISIGGPVTYKNAVDVKEVSKEIPLDKLLIETDCPYLTPQKYRGQRNESAYIKYICEEIAFIRNIDSSVIEEQTTLNAIKLFKIGV